MHQKLTNNTLRICEKLNTIVTSESSVMTREHIKHAVLLLHYAIVYTK